MDNLWTIYGQIMDKSLSIQCQQIELRFYFRNHPAVSQMSDAIHRCDAPLDYSDLAFDFQTFRESIQLDLHLWPLRFSFGYATSLRHLRDMSHRHCP